MTKHKIWIIAALAVCAAGILGALFFMPPKNQIEIYKKIFPLTPIQERHLLSGLSDRNVIKLGVPGPIDDIRATNLFFEGVAMAISEINASNALPLPLEAVISNDNNKIADVLSVAGDYAEDTDIVAVIGHWGSEYSMSAAQVYENAGIIMLTPVSTNPKLTERNFRLVFRNAPTDTIIGAFLADYAHAQSYRDIVALYSKDMTGLQVSHAFESRANSLGTRVLDKHSVYYNLDMVEKNYARWKADGLDAVFIADIITRNEAFQKKLILQNPRLPILATDAYDYDIPLKELSKLAKNINVVTFFNPVEQKQEYLDFCTRFQSLYGKDPDYWALQGYDSVHILSEAIQITGSLDVEDIAATMRNPEIFFASVSGKPVQFDEKGDARSPNLYIKRIVDGKTTYWGKDE